MEQQELLLQKQHQLSIFLPFSFIICRYDYARRSSSNIILINNNNNNNSDSNLSGRKSSLGGVGAAVDATTTSASGSGPISPMRL